MGSRIIISNSDISNSPVLARKFRGKPVKEIYRCAKGILVTHSLAKLIVYAVATIPGPGEMSKGFIYSAYGQVGETTLGYLSGVGFIWYLYRIIHSGKLKVTTRLVYNVVCLPMIIDYKEVGGVFDLLPLSKLEKLWFDQPVSIFDDNRLWIENNFTSNDITITLLSFQIHRLM